MCLSMVVVAVGRCRLERFECIYIKNATIFKNVHVYEVYFFQGETFLISVYCHDLT